MNARALAPVLLAAALAAPLLAPPAAAPARAAGAKEQRVALLTAPANLPDALLGQAVSARIEVRARVAPSGLVEDAHAVSGDARLRAAAEAAVRWWVFTPAPRASREDVTVTIETKADAPTLHPDVLAMGRAAEEGGDLASAIAAWTGALARVGQSPVVADPWALREHVIELARRMPSPPPPPAVVVVQTRGVRGDQERAVARGTHEDLLPRFDEAISAAPWWPDAWLWRAGSLAGCGRVPEALRSLKAYRLAATDTAGIAFAGRMIDRLAAADTIGVCAAIKTYGVVTEKPAR